MASDREYLDLVLEQLSGLEGVSYRPMMGEYVLYYRSKVFGGVYDDRLLIKPVKAAKEFLPDAPLELPYEGGSGMLLVEPDDPELLCALVESMYDELPAPKRKKKN